MIFIVCVELMLFALVMISASLVYLKTEQTEIKYDYIRCQRKSYMYNQINLNKNHNKDIRHINT